MSLAMLIELVRLWLAARSSSEGSAGSAPPPRRILPEEAEMALFARALEHNLVMEGGYSEDPYDPGGPTNLGITLAEFARWRKVALDATSFAALKAELRRITRAEAASIYRANYWDAALCGYLPAGLAVFHFDCAVNQGVAAAARMLQRALSVDVDGAIGPQTIAAARSVPVATALARYADARRAHYRSLSTFWRFGRGWLSRVDSTLALARSIAADPAFMPAKEQAMTDTSTASSQTSTTTGSQTRSQPQSKWWGQSMTVWGVIVTGLSTVLPVVGQLFGINITADLVQQLGEAVVQFGQAGAGVVGLALTLWGRLRATADLTRKEIRLTL
ncbi:MAG: glycosyl hydrolase 108 family protein [Hyphomicrobiaceae bacterium]|nr:glycosyl hydrolase 108 family protein [Hyphomicrobiaceae bacterium]